MVREYLKQVLPETAIDFWRKMRSAVSHLGYKYGFSRPYRCACCGHALVSYIPLRRDPKIMNALSQVHWRDEMVNAEAYSCPWCGAADRGRIYALDWAGNGAV